MRYRDVDNGNCHANLQIRKLECMDFINKLQFCDAVDQCYTFQLTPTVNYTENEQFPVGSFCDAEKVNNEADIMRIFRFEDQSV